MIKVSQTSTWFRSWINNYMYRNAVGDYSSVVNFQDGLTEVEVDMSAWYDVTSQTILESNCSWENSFNDNCREEVNMNTIVINVNYI